jgi:hypothetical protein
LSAPDFQALTQGAAAKCWNLIRFTCGSQVEFFQRLRAVDPRVERSVGRRRARRGGEQTPGNNRADGEPGHLTARVG